MLILQLEMFDQGSLSLKSSGVDVSADAIKNLEREIYDFDALISDDEEKERRASERSAPGASGRSLSGAPSSC